MIRRVPELLASSLEARVERAVEEAIAARRSELEELIDVGLDRALDAIVVERIGRLSASTNGETPPPAPAATVDTVSPLPARAANGKFVQSDHSFHSAAIPAAPALCSRCHAEPRIPGRTIGKACKARQDWQRQRARKAERKAVAAVGDGEEPPRSHVTG